MPVSLCSNWFNNYREHQTWKWRRKIEIESDLSLLGIDENWEYNKGIIYDNRIMCSSRHRQHLYTSEIDSKSIPGRICLMVYSLIKWWLCSFKEQCRLTQSLWKEKKRKRWNEKLLIYSEMKWYYIYHICWYGSLRQVIHVFISGGSVSGIDMKKDQTLRLIPYYRSYQWQYLTERKWDFTNETRFYNSYIDITSFFLYRKMRNACEVIMLALSLSLNTILK